MNRPLSIHSFCDFISDDGGATAIEYAIIASSIAGTIIIVVMRLGTSLQTKYQSVSNSLN
jgi:pilus assembly protein Flp/PilA